MAGSGHDNFIELVVKSTSGVFEERFNLSNKGQKVFDEAMRYFGLNTGSGTTYVLRRESNSQPIALSEKLEDLGLRSGEVLLLQTNQAQDG